MFQCFQWRRVRDLNPGYGITAHTISNRAPSTTQPTLHLYFVVFASSFRSYLSATIFIIAHTSPFVNTFFHFFEKIFQHLQSPIFAAKNSIGMRKIAPQQANTVQSAIALRKRASAYQYPLRLFGASCPARKQADAVSKRQGTVTTALTPPVISASSSPRSCKVLRKAPAAKDSRKPLAAHRPDSSRL